MEQEFFIPDGLSDIGKGDLIEVLASEDLWFLINVRTIPESDKTRNIPMARQVHTKHGGFDTQRMLRMNRGECNTALVLKKIVSASLLDGTSSPLTPTSLSSKVIRVSESFLVLMGEEIIILDPSCPGHGGYYNLDPGYKIRKIQESNR